MSVSIIFLQTSSVISVPLVAIHIRNPLSVPYWAISKISAQPAKRHVRLPGGITDLLKDYNVAVKTIKLDYANLDIAAKTGTMDYVRGLAGYIVTPSGRRLVFAIFSNDLDRRQSRAQRINRRWMARAREFERSLIRNWVLALEG